MRRNAQRLAGELIEVSATTLERYIAWTPRRVRIKITKRLELPRVCSITSGTSCISRRAHSRPNEKKEPTGLVTTESKKAFLDETAKMLRRIGDVATPSCDHYLIDLLASLRLAGSGRVSSTLSPMRFWMPAGMHGFQFKSLGADRFVEIVGIFLAGPSQHLNDQSRRRKDSSVECLDAFVEAGWHKSETAPVPLT